MEKREHPRIQIPLLVELIHPAIGTVQTTAKDISEGGLFVYLANPKIREGGKLKLRVLTTFPTDTQSKPTIEMQVKRVTEEGLGLAFINKTAQHLWSSVQQPRQELAIGRDYFQVHLSLAVLNEKKAFCSFRKTANGCYPADF